MWAVGGMPSSSYLEDDRAFNWDSTRPIGLGSTGFDATSTRMSDEHPSGSRTSQMASGIDRTATFRLRSTSRRSNRGGRRVPIARTAVAISCVSDIELFRTTCNSARSATLSGQGSTDHRRGVSHLATRSPPRLGVPSTGYSHHRSACDGVTGPPSAIGTQPR